jgi:hypothetical protein
MTAVHGTLVARPARTTWYTLSRWLQLCLQGEVTSVTSRLVVKPRTRCGSSGVASSL